MFWPDGQIPNTAIVRKQTFCRICIIHHITPISLEGHLLRHLVARGDVLSKKTSCRELLRKSEYAKMADYAAPGSRGSLSLLSYYNAPRLGHILT